MKSLRGESLTRFVPGLIVLATVAIVASLMPFARHYGQVNGLTQRAERWAQAYADRREARALREAAALAQAAPARQPAGDEAPAPDSAAPTLAASAAGDTPAPAPSADDMTETFIEAEAPAAGPSAEDALPSLAVVPLTDLTEELAGLLAAMPTETGWYPTEYRLADGAFVYPGTVALSTQLHIAGQRQQAGLATDAFTAQVRALHSRDGRLYPAYELDTGLPAAAEESAAAYRQALDYALAAGEHEWAAALRDRLLSRDLPGASH